MTYKTVDDEIKEKYPALWDRAFNKKLRAAAIRVKCLDCSGGNLNEVKLCPAKDCPLYPFRMTAKSVRSFSECTSSASENDNDH